MEKKKQLIFLEDSKGIIKTIDRIGNLYVISDEEIKEGDWVIEPDGLLSIFGYDFRAIWTKEQILNCKKIIATTDSSLKQGKDIPGYITYKSLPQPSQSFIERYVEEYNKGNIITEVKVEYGVTKNEKREFVEFLWVKKDNTINIKPTKNSWNREEIVKLINKFEFDTFPNRYEGYGTEQDDINKWIEENL